jgi:imidazolonepropionase
MPTIVVTPSKDGKSVDVRKNVEMLIKDGKISGIFDIGHLEHNKTDQMFDAKGCLITPGFIDAHTHLFPPGDRAEEFAMRRVMSYKEIAAKGGGILSSVRTLRKGSAVDIFNANRPLIEQFFANGTTTVEVKSGYGLSTHDELKSLEAIKLLQDHFRDKVTIVPTFMGAHAVPDEYKGKLADYVDLICKEMIPAVAKQGIAQYCDVFCEKGYFDDACTRQILIAAKTHGLKIRIHADEFADSGGAALAAEIGADSADHLMAVSDDGIKKMAAAGVIPIVLPGATVFLGKV